MDPVQAWLSSHEDPRLAAAAREHLVSRLLPQLERERNRAHAAFDGACASGDIPGQAAAQQALAVANRRCNFVGSTVAFIDQQPAHLAHRDELLRNLAGVLSLTDAAPVVVAKMSHRWLWAAVTFAAFAVGGLSWWCWLR